MLGSQASINKALISVCLFVCPIITYEPKLTNLPQSFAGEIDITGNVLRLFMRDVYREKIAKL